MGRLQIGERRLVGGQQWVSRIRRSRRRTWRLLIAGLIRAATLTERLVDFMFSKNYAGTQHFDRCRVCPSWENGVG